MGGKSEIDPFLYDFEIGIKYVLHYLDNFLLAESLESGEGVKCMSNPWPPPFLERDSSLIPHLATRLNSENLKKLFSFYNGLCPTHPMYL